MGYRTLAAALSLSLAMLAAPAAAQLSAEKAAKLAITPGSAEAAILIKADALPPPPLERSAYLLSLQTYDPELKAMRGGPFGGQVTIYARPRLVIDGYLIVPVKPGTYAFRDVVRQTNWSVCFNEDSLQFTIRPGELLYLGAFDARVHIAEIERMTIESMQTITSKPVIFFDHVTPPAFAPVTDEGLAAAAAMAKARMPKTTVAPSAVAFTQARFGTGNDLFGISRLCGGYYQKRAKG